MRRVVVRVVVAVVTVTVAGPGSPSPPLPPFPFRSSLPPEGRRGERELGGAVGGAGEDARGGTGDASGAPSRGTPRGTLGGPADGPPFPGRGEMCLPRGGDTPPPGRAAGFPVTGRDPFPVNMPDTPDHTDRAAALNHAPTAATNADTLPGPASHDTNPRTTKTATGPTTITGPTPAGSPSREGPQNLR